MAPQKIEAIFKCSHPVSEIFRWEDSYQNFLVAIVMPKMEVIKQWTAEKHNANLMIKLSLIYIRKESSLIKVIFLKIQIV